MADSYPGQQPFTVYPNKGKYIVYGIFFFSMVTIFFAGYFYFAQYLIFLSNPIPVGIIIVLALLIYGALFITFRMVLSGKPLLTISHKGMEIGNPAMNVGVIPWDTIQLISPYSYSGKEYVKVVPKDIKAALRNVGLIQKMTMQANTKLCGSPFLIQTENINVTKKEILQAIQKYFPITPS